MRSRARVAALVLAALIVTSCAEEQQSSEPPAITILIVKDGPDPHVWLIGTDAEMRAWITNPELIPPGDGPRQVVGVIGKQPTERDGKTYVTFTIGRDHPPQR